MNNILQWLVMAEDVRQQGKVKHLMRDIIALVFFAEISNATEWIEIYLFGVANETALRKYLQLPNGIPSHDTIQRVFAMISPEYLQDFRKRWDEVMSGSMRNRVRKILALDGKTQCGNATANQKANHIVSAVDNNGFCVGEVLVDEKSNEITAIPELLKTLNIKDYTITIDAMGCQTEITKIIRKKRANYLISLKRNQGTLHDDVQRYFSDPELLAGCAYHKKFDKAHSASEIREYWQTDDIAWLEQKKQWPGFSTIAMTKNTIIKGDTITTEVRYFISSLPLDVKAVAFAIRSHWMVESYHWHLDVTFGEDGNHTLDQAAAFNLNIIKKMAINTLRLVDVGIPHVSMKNKRFLISMDFDRFLDVLMTL